MKGRSFKLIMTGAALFGALALVGMGTFAWVTLSTKGVANGISITMAGEGDWPYEIIQQEENWKPQTVQELLDAKHVLGATREDNDPLTCTWEKHLTLQTVPVTQKDKTVVEHTVGDCYQLRPISTSDGQHWFLAAYDDNGNVSNVSYLDEEGFDAVYNVNRYDPEPKKNGDDIPSNYVYTFDVWIKSQKDEKAYDLKLNNPYADSLGYGTGLSKSQSNLDNEGTNFFGTFVLPGLTAVETTDEETGKTTTTYEITQESINASRCVRVGFLMYDYTDENGNVLTSEQVNSSTPLYKDVDDGNGNITKVALETPREFWIYEPNVDGRAVMKDFAKNAANSYEQQIGDGIKYLLNEGREGVKLESYDQIASQYANKDVPTVLPSYTASAKAGDPGTVTLSAENNADHIIKQTCSSWKSDILEIAKEKGGTINSGDIGSLGAFIPVDNNGVSQKGYEGIDTPVMGTVYKNVPQHIRIFIWLEGQDVDCWDTTMAGNLLINLEFRGDEVTETETEGEGEAGEGTGEASSEEAGS